MGRVENLNYDDMQHRHVHQVLLVLRVLSGDPLDVCVPRTDRPKPSEKDIHTRLLYPEVRSMRIEISVPNSAEHETAHRLGQLILGDVPFPTPDGT
jgi:hypothetical protein